jgi:cholesterol transport system auxiliary component
MMRPFVALLALLGSSCASHSPLAVRYDLDGKQVRSASEPRLNATIALSPIQAPSWLRTTALIYRLDYEAPAHPRAYTQSQWTAPPGEMLTLRLRNRISAVNDGFTLDHLRENADGYRLEVTLDNFSQIFPSPDESRCVVILSATIVQHGERVLAQRTFEVERPAPSANAAGAVEGLIDASDSNFDQILTWLRSTLPTPP